jgi:hypothetical protein
MKIFEITYTDGSSIVRRAHNAECLHDYAIAYGGEYDSVEEVTDDYVNTNYCVHVEDVTIVDGGEG